MNAHPSRPAPADRSPDRATGRPFWSETLRALREARGATQEGWAALLGVSRKTVQRWEQATAVPDPLAEAALADLCRQRGLFRPYDQGPLRGVTLTPELLRDLLAEARIAPLAAPAPPPAAAPAARLAMRTGDGRTTNIPLEPDTTTIGRGGDNRIVIPSEHVSRYHARVTWSGSAFTVEDLGSKNGTAVNGEPVTAPRPLQDGDRIVLSGLAEYALQFDSGDRTVTVARAALPGGGLWVDTRAREAWLRGRALRLRPEVFRILAALYEQAGRVVPAATLARAAHPDAAGDPAAVVEPLIDELLGHVQPSLDAPPLIVPEAGGYRLALT